MGRKPVARECCVTIHRRVARKQHRCDCGALIHPGEAYLVHTLFPGHDAGFADRHPVRIPQCAWCSEQRGRTHLLVDPDA